jgi:hypothetical protein
MDKTPSTMLILFQRMHECENSLWAHLRGIARADFCQLISQGHAKPIKVGRRNFDPVDYTHKLLDGRRMADPIAVRHEAEVEAPCQGVLPQDGDATW